LRSLLSELGSENQLFAVADEPTGEIRRRSRTGTEWVEIVTGSDDSIHVFVSALPVPEKESPMSTVDLRRIGIDGRLDVRRRGTQITIRISGGIVETESKDQLSFW
ncbi:MAG TPA: hypothetical protein VHU17_03840, partial [Acidimicrobiales bacterium]|nr:hypothetical protein [Acidimicrobiales bacterium]